MSLNHKPPADADALLRAMGQALRERADERPVEKGKNTPEEDEALIASITQRVLAQQHQVQPPSAVVALAPRSRRPLWIGVATAASLVLALLLMPMRFGTTALPAYTAEISGIDSSYRSDKPGALPPTQGSITLGNRLIVTARPERATDVPLVAALWRAEPDGFSAIPVPLQHSPNGTVRLDAVVGRQLLLAPGTHRLWLVVAPAMPALDVPALLASNAAEVSARDHYVLPMTLTVRAP